MFRGNRAVQLGLVTSRTILLTAVRFLRSCGKNWQQMGLGVKLKLLATIQMDGQTGNKQNRTPNVDYAPLNAVATFEQHLSGDAQIPVKPGSPQSTAIRSNAYLRNKQNISKNLINNNCFAIEKSPKLGNQCKKILLHLKKFIAFPLRDRLYAKTRTVGMRHDNRVAIPRCIFSTNRKRKNRRMIPSN